MYKTIVFDLDGTLLDTLDDLTDAVNAALTKFSLPTRTKEEVRLFVGNGIRKLIYRAAGASVPAPIAEEILTEFKGYYRIHCADKTGAYAGILPLLKTLKEKGIATAVVSNKADFATKKLAKEYFDGLLDAAIGENEEAGIFKKPDPAALLSVLKTLHAEKRTTAYVGDSDVDIQTAKNAGVDCISVTWGFRDREFLLENGATRLIDSPAEILSLCDLS